MTYVQEQYIHIGTQVLEEKKKKKAVSENFINKTVYMVGRSEDMNWHRESTNYWHDTILRTST